MHIRTRTSNRRDLRGRPVKRYQATWTENDGIKRAQTFDTREEAQDKLDSVKKLLAQNKSPSSLRELGRQHFGVVADQWLKSRHDLKPRYRAECENLLAAKRKASRADLSIAATFNHRPVNAITRAEITKWVGALDKAGKSPSTIRHHFYVVSAVLDQAVADGRIIDNPAKHVKLPTTRIHTDSHTVGSVDDPETFLNVDQVTALQAATPAPFDVLVHVAVWSGLRAAELCGLQVRDFIRNGNGAMLAVERTVIDVSGTPYDTPKTKGSRRRVPLTPETTAILSDYLDGHPRRDDPQAPLFPAVTLVPSKPTGKKATDGAETAKERTHRQAMALAALSADEHAGRLVLDWNAPMRHSTFYKNVFKPAIHRANRIAGKTVVPPNLTFHSLRHTYASLCVAAGIPPLEISRFMGHSKVTTTLTIYSHLFPSDHTEHMTALAAMNAPAAENVVAMRKRS